MAVSVELGKPLDDFLTKLVTNGRYRSRSEVLREGVRLVQEREAKLMAVTGLIDEVNLSDQDERRTALDDVFKDLSAQSAISD